MTWMVKVECNNSDCLHKETLFKENFSLSNKICVEDACSKCGSTPLIVANMSDLKLKKQTEDKLPMPGVFTPEFLNWARTVTNFYDGKKKVSRRDQMKHIMEECGESYAELINGSDKKLALELADIIFAALTMYHRINLTDEEIEKAMSKTIKKINKRCAGRDV